MIRFRPRSRSAAARSCRWPGGVAAPPPTLFRAQIRSLQDQPHRNWVCLVNDDGSNEGLYRRIRALLSADRRFVVRRNDRNLGFFHNFERCLAAVPAEAGFVALADQD